MIAPKGIPLTVKNALSPTVELLIEIWLKLRLELEKLKLKETTVEPLDKMLTGRVVLRAAPLETLVPLIVAVILGRVVLMLEALPETMVWATVT